MSSDEALLQQIYDDEERDKIVYSIREELMENVMTECYKSYIKKQTIKFIVQCAYDAMVKFLCINFYYHCDPPDIGNSIWIPDKPIDPSPKDTWAHGAVPIRSINLGKDEKFDEEEETSIGKNYPDNYDFEQCMCLHICDCCNLLKSEASKSLSTSFEKPCPSRVKFSPRSSKLKVPEKTESTYDEASKTLTLSSGTQSTPASIVDINMSRSPSEKVATTVSKDDVKRKKDKPLSKESKLVVPLAVERGSRASMVKLPPIRVNTKFTSKPGEIKKKKKR